MLSTLNSDLQNMKNTPKLKEYQRKISLIQKYNNDMYNVRQNICDISTDVDYNTNVPYVTELAQIQMYNHEVKITIKMAF